MPSRPRHPLPAPPALPLLLAALLPPGLALTAAATNLQWGAHPSAPDAFPLAWYYVNLGVAANWFLLWPAAALRPNPADPTTPNHSTWLQFSAIIIAIIPALALAAYLSAPPAAILAQTIMLQLLFAAASGSLLACRWTTPRAQALVAGLLAGSFLVLPIFAYLQAEFLPALPRAWSVVAPLIALHRVTMG